METLKNKVQLMQVRECPLTQLARADASSKNLPGLCLTAHALFNLTTTGEAATLSVIRSNHNH